MISFVRPIDFHSSTVIVSSFHISSITSAIRDPTSSSCADMVATCLISSFVFKVFAFLPNSSINLLTVLCNHLPRANGLTHERIYLSHSFAIA